MIFGIIQSMSARHYGLMLSMVRREPAHYPQPNPADPRILFKKKTGRRKKKKGARRS
ncbi:hypothetical protein [Komagataeibacter xylinus]|uniref:hypothetical protein n=1 Tax=Komagataeibacter xylinus TaxID=28448 RepID=UPI00280B1BE7|nr:hypothetical protein [Komagataeibacter xylinus]